MDVFERVYFMRAIAGVVAGVMTGFVMPFQYPQLDQYMSVGIALGIAIVTYIISVVVARSIARDVPKEKRRKVATEGIIPFIFLLMVFMVIIYTGLHQCEESLRPLLNISGCAS